MLLTGAPFISEKAKTNSKLATRIDKLIKEQGKAKNEFFYWLGYYDGQDSVLNKVMEDTL